MIFEFLVCRIFMYIKKIGVLNFWFVGFSCILRRLESRKNGTGYMVVLILVVFLFSLCIPFIFSWADPLSKHACRGCSAFYDPPWYVQGVIILLEKLWDKIMGTSHNDVYGSWMYHWLCPWVVWATNWLPVGLLRCWDDQPSTSALAPAMGEFSRHWSGIVCSNLLKVINHQPVP